MNAKEPRISLSFHSGRNPDIDDPRWQSYFLGSLRPFKSMAEVENNYHHIVECLRQLPIELFQHSSVPKDLAADIAGITCLGRAWAVDKGGMLRSNKLISKADSRRIEDWLHTIDYVWMMLLDTQDHELAFEVYTNQRQFAKGSD